MKKIFLIFAFALLLFSFVSATNYKLTKVSDLKQGDIIIDKDGNEIPVTSILAKQVAPTISEYLNEKVSGTANSSKIKVTSNIKSYVGVGNQPTLLTGNAVKDSTPQTETPNWFQKMIAYLRSIKYGTNK